MNILFVAAYLLLPLASSASTLTLTFATNTISETQITNATTATVAADSILAAPLTVTIINGNSNELYLPPTVIIPTGASSVSFTVDAVNNPAITGPTNVLVIASAPGYSGAGSATITVLDDDTPTNLTIGGHLFGHLTTNTYHVTGDLVVDSGQTLRIDPASKMLFSPGVGLANVGTLTATGAPNAFIQFAPDLSVPAGIPWTGISNTGPRATFIYTEVSYAHDGLVIFPAQSNPTITISNSFVHDCISNGVQVRASGGIVINGNTVHIAGNTICRNGNDGVHLQAFCGPIDHFCRGSSNSTVILGNAIFDNANAGIEMFVYSTPPNQGGCDIPTFGKMNCTIAGNRIYGNGYAIYGWATTNLVNFYSRQYSVIQNNLIFSNIFGIWLTKPNDAAEFFPVIVNNTIVQNGNAGIYHDLRTTNGFLVENNLVGWNQIGISSSGAFEPTNTAVIFNDVWGNSIANWYGYPVNYGVAATNNLDGTSTDAYANISADPLFVSATDFHLQPASPAIDAGATYNAPASDFGGTSRRGFPDIGAYEFGGLLLTLGLKTGNNPFALTITGGRGTPFEIDASADLIHWAPQTVGTLTNRLKAYSWPRGGAQEFYRGRVL